MRVPTKPSGPFADPTRAAEIASMEEFGLAQFTEITGIGAGDYGNFRVSAAGVLLVLAAEFDKNDLSNWPTEQQLAIQRALQAPALTFPCSPQTFMDWYETTRGQTREEGPGASDFPLAEAFEKAVRRRGDASSTSGRFSCTSGQIAAAFAVNAEPAKNARWWAARLSDPGKYGGKSHGGGSLVQARASLGNPKNPSRWYPDVVAAWLIERGYLSAAAVIQAMERSFPAVDFEVVSSD